ncbi:MAG: glycosyltransferase [Minisyncoccia bacterium]
MKLLICTQAVDENDPVLGFFARWIEEFSKHSESVEVICLKAGRFNLPENVRVHSLGKERGVTSRAAHAWRFFSLAWRLRRDYDAVFVHMNPEYLVLAGWLWRALGKRSALWYTHKSVNLKLRLAVLYANVVFTASPESFRLPTKKLQVMGHGIDTDFFTPDLSVARGEGWLSVGRLSPSKRHDLALRAAAQAGRELRIAGEGPERHHVESLAKELNTRVAFLGPLTQAQLRDEYRRAALLIHRSETGSLDKVVLEAAACGLPVDTTDPALAKLPLGVEYVRDRHSLRKLIPRILTGLSHG